MTEQRLRDTLSGVMARLTQSLEGNQGWLRLERGELNQKQAFYYNRNIRGLFPDLSRPDYTKPLLHINCPTEMKRIFSFGLSLAGMRTSLIEKKELRAAFPSRDKLEPVAARWNWRAELPDQYFAVLPCKQGSEVCRIDGKPSSYWGADTPEKACLIIVVHLADYVSGSTWQDDLLFLMKENFTPVSDTEEARQDTEFLTRYGAFIERKDGVFIIARDMSKEPKIGEDAIGELNVHKVVKPKDETQKAIIRAELLECDYYRAGLIKYDNSILNPLNGHWDLWEYVQYNDCPAEQLPPPPEGRIWVDVSEENIYARNAADDLAPAAETVAVDFGTKSTTVARMDNAGNIVTIPIGECSVPESGRTEASGIDKNGGKGYENPTILKYIDLDSFQAAYRGADGRPNTRFTDLSASHTAEQQFEERTLAAINSIFAYQYQIKQWAYDNRFEPLILDSHRQIRLKPFREIGADDFDPIEAYAYLVGLTVVNMRRYSICARYVLSYPPSYGTDICEKIRKSFEKGIRKAIPVQAQRTRAFQENFSVLLRQSEPAAYAVCAVREFAINHKQALCGVYDLGGGTVDYHFGIFTGGNPPYKYESRKNGGNPRLGCENILEALAYEVYSLVKDGLLKKGISYEFPRQFPGNLEDVRYTSHSQRARFNTLGMINALRGLWTHNFKPVDEERDCLCYFQIYSETRDEPYFLEIEAAAAGKAENEEIQARLEEMGEASLKISLPSELLVNYFRGKLAITVREFLDMLRVMRESTDSALPSVIFLAGNGSRAPLVSEIFHEYLSESGMENCQLYHPLSTPEAVQEGQIVINRVGSIPNAKTGVAHGLLIALPGSDFVTTSEKRRQFVFRYHLGVSLYNQALRDKVFYRIKSADSFARFEKYGELSVESLEISFAVLADGHLQIWYTDATLTSDYTAVRACSAALKKAPKTGDGGRSQDPLVQEMNRQLDLFAEGIRQSPFFEISELIPISRQIDSEIHYFLRFFDFCYHRQWSDVMNRQLREGCLFVAEKQNMDALSGKFERLRHLVNQAIQQ